MAADSDLWVDDVGSESDSGEDDDDSWFYASMKRYKNLHMFDLQQSTRVLEWVRKTSICVAGFEEKKRNEILELDVPDRLLPKSTDEGLCRDRDFKIRGGGFSTNPIWSLKSIPNSMKIVTSEFKSDSIQIYQLGKDNNDVISHLSGIKMQDTDLSTPCLDADSKCVVFGSSLTNLSTADLQTGQVTATSNCSIENGNQISKVSLLSDHTVLVNSKLTGQIHILDFRNKTQIVASSGNSLCEGASKNDLSWTMAVSIPQNGDSMNQTSTDKRLANVVCVGCLSSTGNLLFWDVNQLKEPTQHWTLAHSSDKDTFLSLQASFPNIIRMLLDEEKLLMTNTDLAKSYKGFDGNVYVYDSTFWVPGIQQVSSAFTHDGHSAGKVDQTSSVMVTTHEWHPVLPNIILSAATDKSLHAWEWQTGE